MKDVLIIGAGITGTLIAHKLSHYDLDVAVIEKGGDVACGATMANSAIIHAGHDPKPGTLKAKFNVLGNRMYPALCKDLQVAYEEIGAHVIACSEEEEALLTTLYQQAKQRDIPVSWLSREELLEKEPHCSKHCRKALFLPTTGIITPWEVAIAAMEESMLNGTSLYLNEKVIGITKTNQSYEVRTNKQLHHAKLVICCAGVHGDEVARLLGKEPRYTITPRRGEYYVLDHLKEPLVHTVLYPVPSAAGKGVLVVPTVHQNTLLGPNSEPITDKEGNETTAELDTVKMKIGRMIESVPFDKIIRSFSGLRPSGSTHDFVIEEDADFENFIHVSAIESPGLASAPAIADYVVTELCKEKFPFKHRETYFHRKPQIVMEKLTLKQQEELIRENPAFGRILCRCEKISEGEILDAIHRPCGATTIKGVKKRVRPGMGRCQGGFCEPQILKLLAKELSVPINKICYDSERTPILKAGAKEEF